MTTEDQRHQHPAYGFIRLSRTQGGNGLLFMSPLRHDHRITIVVGEAEQIRSNNYDTYYPRRSIVEVDMSEGQFAQFICNAYSSSGAPCTIRRSESGPRQPIEVPQLNERDGVFVARCSHRGCGARGPKHQDLTRACDLFCCPPQRTAGGSVVVLVSGKTGGVHLSHVEVLP